MPCSGTAQSLTFGAQTGRGSDRSCVIKRTNDYQFYIVMNLVHQLAQNVVGPALPYLGFQILKLGVGKNLNQHRDYHNHPDYPNHTMKFGKYRGGSLQMLRDGTWHSYDKENQWLSFDALKVVHQVTPVTYGERYSITLYTPGKLDRLSAQDWDNLAGGINLMRVFGHRTRTITQLAYLQAAAERKDKQCYLWTLVNILRLVCCMTSEAGLETVLSAAFSLKHETDMMKTFSSRQEAFDKAKETGLTPEKASKNIRETPSGRVAFYDEARGEPVKPHDWKPPDFKSLR